MQPLSAVRTHVVNHYTILGLPQPRGASPTPITKDELKAAYHRALLLNHPDKAPRSDINVSLSRNSRTSETQHGIDQIIRAYQTLLDPVLKAEYDKQLLLSGVSATKFENELYQKGLHLGVETYDLDDLTYHEERARWSKKCRCGNEEGYIVTEAELDRASNHGEVYVGCRGCSLFIKVLFGLVEESDTA